MQRNCVELSGIFNGLIKYAGGIYNIVHLLVYSTFMATTFEAKQPFN